eukprot:TRINITY_DN3371_c0_g1_i1.p1 TRINITY_DN3371_c0_g1~~TRINITY_DN3371_c0_g1_i1.p1  ORF type:complete len:219 (-),score=46.59 TRINITY_DN3371_c0_g1_i1:162-764(-)
MKIVAVVFPGLTFLDFVGFYDTVTRLKSMHFMPSLTFDIASYASPQVGDDRDHLLTLNVPLVRPKLSEYDVVFVPGGYGTRTLVKDEEFLAWFRTEAKDVRYKMSVCTGSLVLGAAGFLADKRATTHPNALDDLQPLVKELVRDERIVHDGNCITGGGVATSVDLGLYVCEMLASTEAREAIQKQIDYPYYDPSTSLRRH